MAVVVVILLLLVVRLRESLEDLTCGEAAGSAENSEAGKWSSNAGSSVGVLQLLGRRQILLKG